MRSTLSIFIIILLTACGGNDGGEPDNSKSQSQFTGSFDQQKLDVAVRCRSFSENYFSFHSDDSQMKDSNGDGIVLNGFQTGNKLAFDITTEKGFYSSPNLGSFNKTAKQATGQGNLFPEEGFQQVPVKFTVICE